MLTDKQIAKLPKGIHSAGRDSFGLRVRVHKASDGTLTHSWIQRLSLNGRQVSAGLGRWPAISALDAFDLAVDNYRTARRGVDPRTGETAPVVSAPAPRRPKAKASPTVAQALDAVLKLRKMKPNTAKAWRSTFDNHAAELLPRPVGSLTSADIMRVLEAVWQAKPTVGRSLLQRISAVCDWAKAHGHRDDNPCEAVSAALPQNGNGSKHHAALDWRDVPAALAKADGYSTPMPAHLFRFMVATAVRISEAIGARWSEIDFEARTWTIPAHRMKASAEHRVPLSDYAMSVLEEARSLAEAENATGKFVFPSISPRGKGRPYARQILGRLFDAVGIEATAHGFRSSFANWATEYGCDRELRERCLAHAESNAVVAAYTTTDRLEERRVLMQDWGAFVSG